MNPHSSPLTKQAVDAEVLDTASLEDDLQAAAASQPALVRAGLAWLLLGIIGLPLAWLVLGAAGRVDLRVPAMVTGVIVLGSSLASLLPLVLTRHAQPMVREVSGRLMHVTMRLILTAGGLILYLVLLPDTQRLAGGLIALGWYAASWVFELVFLVHKRAELTRQAER